MWATSFTPNSERASRRGFTIVELLIVIVVIGILAAITIVAYNGVTQKARVATISSDLEGAMKQLEIYKITTSSGEQYPVDLATANLRASSGTVYTYNENTNSNTYCLSATNSNTTYTVVTGNKTPQLGDCTTAGLVGWWKLNGNANDSTVGGSNGTVTNATLVNGQNGQGNGAYVFNGSTTYITLADIDVPSYTTVSAWVNPSVAGQGTKIMAKHTGGGDAQGTLGLTGGSAQFETTTGGTYNNPIGAAALPVGSWSLVTGVYDGAGTIVYVNGVSAASRAASGALATNSVLWTIGAMPSHTGGFSGSIDDVRVYSRALTLVEIQALYTAGAQ